MTEQTIKAFENFPPETIENRNYYIQYLLDFKRENASLFNNYGAFKLAFPGNVDTDVVYPEEERFNTNNWNDPFIDRIREFFVAILNDDKTLFKDTKFRIKEDGYRVSIFTTKDDIKFEEIIRFDFKPHEDQTTIVFDFLETNYKWNHHVYMTWYKSRGRTEQMLTYDLTPVELDTLIEFHKVLDSIGFERFII